MSIQYLIVCYLADASKSGVAQETLQNAARRAGKVMTEQEARQILGISEETAWEEVLKASIFLLSLLSSFSSHIPIANRGSKNILSKPAQRYDTLFENNAKNGSFYLQSKVHRAKECLEAAYKDKGQGTPTPN